MKKIVLLGLIAVLSFSFFKGEKPLGLNVGEMAPDFISKNQNGKEINLKNLLKTGKVVILFYRGEWCSYCNKQLKTLEDSLSYITAKGANVVAISPETSENVIKTVDKTKATFSIISDSLGKIMTAYKVNWTLDRRTTEKYKTYGIVLEDRNAGGGNELPVPAVYIINMKGEIIYRYFDENYSKRASVKEILSNL